MRDSPASSWRDAFLATIRQTVHAEPLRSAAGSGKRAWTEAMTAAIVASCVRLGWEAAARNHIPARLPVPRSEYLSVDVMAFTPGKAAWPLPIAALELENQQRDDYIAYNLWKLLCIRVPLRVLVCYRPQAERGSALVGHLEEQVIAGLSIDERLTLGGETLLVIGSQGDVDTFPHGFFRWWLLETNTGRFGRW